MIKILQDWDEVGEAVNYLHKNRLPLHATPQKNWDHYLLADLLRPRDRQLRIVDMGCGPGSTLLLLNKLGFQNLLGLDLRIWPAARVNQIRAFWTSTHKRLPWKMRRRDICETELPPESIDVISCISVIEHGVPLGLFAKECARLLKVNGLLFITTDYWDSCDRRGAAIPTQQCWHLQDRCSISQFIETCSKDRLLLLDNVPLPQCNKAVVNYEGVEYTFIALAMKRVCPQNIRA